MNLEVSARVLSDTINFFNILAEVQLGNQIVQQPVSFLMMAMDAELSPCGRYRYWLSRCNETPSSSAIFILLNPSTADAQRDDPTLRRCMRFAGSWGCSRTVVLNLFALRSTNPAVLKTHPDPIGPLNDGRLVSILETEFNRRNVPEPIVVCAWGNQGSLRNRANIVSAKLGPYSAKCFGITNKGQPRHPLYVKSDTALLPFNMASYTF
jgi:hypothetical protein